MLDLKNQSVVWNIFQSTISLFDESYIFLSYIRIFFTLYKKFFKCCFTKFMVKSSIFHYYKKTEVISLEQ